MAAPLHRPARLMRWLASALLVLGASALAEPLQVAVASNFAVPAHKIAAAFEQTTGQAVRLSVGATGKFYAQIRHGAPFAVLLAADSETPARLVKEGLAVRGSAFTYAIGQLVLWSPQAGLVDAQGQVLRGPLPGKLAIAEPRLAPYGAAAQQTLERLGLLAPLRAQLVTGENIGQTYQFVASGNAALGFVALSQLMADGRIAAGSWWRVPDDWHAPIRQDAVLLKKGEHLAAARAFLQHLRSEASRETLRAHGYRL